MSFRVYHDVFLAQTDNGSVTLWPREFFPDADSALTAHAECSDESIDEVEELRVRLAWAWPDEVSGYFWRWEFDLTRVPRCPAEECWALERTA